MTPITFFSWEAAGHRIDLHVRDGARRNIVKNDRNVDGVVNRLDVEIHALLGRFVVIGHDDENRIGADVFGVLGVIDRFCGGVGTGSGDNRDALVRRLNTDLHDALVFLVAYCRAFARRSNRYEAVGPLLDLPVDKACICGLIDRVVLIWRNQCGE